MTKDFTSSEESGKETMEDGYERTVLYIKPLRWRPVQQTTGFHPTNDKVKTLKSKNGIQQTLALKIGDISN